MVAPYDSIKKTYSIKFLDQMADDTITQNLQTPLLQSKICGNCGYDFNDFIKTGFLGCSLCYQYFQKDLESYLDELR